MFLGQMQLKVVLGKSTKVEPKDLKEHWEQGNALVMTPSNSLFSRGRVGERRGEGLEGSGERRDAGGGAESSTCFLRAYI